MKKEAGTFCTLFPVYRDYHFYKDPGQVPYRVSKLGYDAYIVCYGNKDDYPESKKYLRIRALSGKWLSRKFNASIVRFLVFNSRKIDILNVFHITWPSLLFVFIYKSLHRKGFAYLKLDNCVFSGTYPWEEDFAGAVTVSRSRKTLNRRIKGAVVRRFFLGKVDLWSVEDEYSRKQYEGKYEFFRGRIITVTNGHTSDLPDSVPPGAMEEKEEIILTAGRLGSYQKATEVLLEAFRLAAPGNSYKLHLAGPVEPSFRQSAEAFIEANPDLRERIIFHGPLGREDLYRLYKRSRIFCMSSRYEGMAIVYPEAMYYSNAIVTTWPVSLKWYIDNYGAGITAEKDDPEALALALGKLLKEDNLRVNMAEKAHLTAGSLMNWDTIAAELIMEIEKRSGKERNHGQAEDTE